ncbi:MAG TPA: hypothetical protein VFF72_05835 [Caldimonas sp.]|nr:hypothetical protein [Caldimonas sp.]
MKTHWRTLWQQRDIVVYRDEVEVDRLAADRIARVLLVYRGHGDFPGDIATSIVELAGDPGGFVLFDACTGFAGRVNFERQAYWQERACVYWVPAPSAALPWRLRLGGWRGEAATRAFRRIGRSELEGCIAGWVLEGPQIWEERKQSRLERSRPFGAASTGWRAAA